MKTKEEVGDLLEGVLGNSNVYFQPPTNIKLKYPCMVYKFVTPKVDRAGNMPYIVTGHWEVHHMYKDPDNSLVEKMLFASPFVAHDNNIVSEGVYNDYYTIYQ